MSIVLDAAQMSKLSKRKSTLKFTLRIWPHRLSRKAKKLAVMGSLRLPTEAIRAKFKAESKKSIAKSSE